MPTDLERDNSSIGGKIKLKTMELTDVLGNTVDPTAAREMIFTFNVMNRHWNVVRLILSPQPELQLLGCFLPPKCSALYGAISL